jgi:hypothetical protein
MTTLHLVPKEISELYEVHEWRNATGIMQTAYPKEWEDLKKVLMSFRLHKSEILCAGGRKSKIADRFDLPFYENGWSEKKFDTKIVVDEREFIAPTHKVDCYKNNVAIEVEWNNKDPFYDRDLNNFRLLFDLRAIEVGIIITRSTELQQIFNELGKGSSYGNSTTHMDKLLPRIEGGSGGGCPILVFGITKQLYVEEDIICG